MSAAAPSAPAADHGTTGEVATFPLPAECGPAVDAAVAGRAVVLTHAATGRRFRLTPVAGAGADGRTDDEMTGDEMTDAEMHAMYAAAQLYADGGEKLTEREALRRAIAFNEAEEAAGRGPLTQAEADAEMEAEFPELKAHRERRRRERERRT